MVDIDILQENPLTMAEMKEKLEALKKSQELSQRATKTYDYIGTFAHKPKKVEEARKKIEALDIARLKPRHIVKILDIYPDDVDSLKAIFTGENLTLKQDDLKKILECL
jgi:DNA-directed RNA polymerase subunit F